MYIRRILHDRALVGERRVVSAAGLVMKWGVLAVLVPGCQNGPPWR